MSRSWIHCAKAGTREAKEKTGRAGGWDWAVAKTRHGTASSARRHLRPADRNEL